MRIRPSPCFCLRNVQNRCQRSPKRTTEGSLTAIHRCGEFGSCAVSTESSGSPTLQRKSPVSRTCPEAEVAVARINRPHPKAILRSMLGYRL